MSLNFIKRLVGQGREKTREEIIAHIVRRAHDQYHHATNEMDLDTRVAMRNYRVDIALPEGKFGPEAALSIKTCGTDGRTISMTRCGSPS